MSLFQNERPKGARQFGRIFPPNPQWLAKQPAEPILEPELPIVDTHHHVWDLPNNRYLIQEFAADLQTGHNVVATVYVDCQAMYRARGPEEMRPIGETEFVRGVGAMSDSGAYGPTHVAQGIVSFAELALGDRVAPVLEAHIAAGGGRFRGIRYATGWDASEVIGNSHAGTGPHVLLRPEVRAGLKRLEALGLSLDAWVFHPQLGDVIEIARSMPGLNIILGHVGGALGYGPYENREEVFRVWRASMTEMAKQPNVSVKLGGMVMRLAAYDYLALATPPSSTELAAYWRRYIETCIELFGPERCMFESNFPVDKLGTGYPQIWNAFKRITAGASDGEKQALYNGTARRVYRLD
jgi:predicted TIM-barrel fold metal-dependent hydrolase